MWLNKQVILSYEKAGFLFKVHKCHMFSGIKSRCISDWIESQQDKVQDLSGELHYVSRGRGGGLVSFHKTEVCLLIICSFVPIQSPKSICIVWGDDKVDIPNSRVTMGSVLDTTKHSEVAYGCFSKHLNYCFLGRMRKKIHIYCACVEVCNDPF